MIHVLKFGQVRNHTLTRPQNGACALPSFHSRYSTLPSSNFKNILLCKRGHEQELSLDLKNAYGDTPVQCSIHQGWVDSSSKIFSLESTWATQILPDYKSVRSDSNAKLASFASDLIKSHLKQYKAPPECVNWNWDLHAIPSAGTSWQSKIKSIETLVSTELKKSPFFKSKLKSNPSKPNFLQSGDVLIQMFMKEANAMAVSISPITKTDFFLNKPLPWYSGYVTIPFDKKYPAGSYMKAKEILLHMQVPQDGLQGKRVCELGAMPGGWTMVLLEHGATLDSVDWAELTEPWLVNHPSLTHHVHDARIFDPIEAGLLVAPDSYDYLFADLALPPEKSLVVFNNWIKNRLTKRFAWTFKFGFHSSDKYSEMIQQIRENLRSYGPDLIFSIRHIFKHENEIVVLGGWKE